MFNDFFKKTFIVLSVIFCLFLVLRFSGVHLPLHQDEYKWVIYSHPELTPPGTVPHPPLTEFIYTRIGPLVGDNNFRTIPLSFTVINFFLLFYLVSFLFDKKTAVLSLFVFSISFYSILASLTVDVDGAVMPFFFLLMCIGYLKWKKTDYKGNADTWKWILLMFFGAIGGFMIKVSAVLPIFAVFLDLLVEKRVFEDKKKLLKYSVIAVSGVILLVLILFLAKYIFPFFNLQYSLNYWKHFANSSSFLGRGWFQTFIQFFKSVLYTSPLLILPVLFIDIEVWKKTRAFFFFIFTGLTFYLFVFDFSIGALDRYFQFLVIPLSIIASGIYIKAFENVSWERNKNKIIGIVSLSLFLFVLQFVPQFVPPLHPKSEWIARALSLKWNFLYPFTGGSGPIGFYISFLFISLSWIFSILLVFIGKSKSEIKNISIVFIFVLGLVYNIAFFEEYLFGKINGSSSKVLYSAVEYIKNAPEIKWVTVYNDNGGFNIQSIGKYRKRLYVDPMFNAQNKVDTLNQYKEHYLEINIPRIDPNSFYRRYLDSCKVVFLNKSEAISATVYDCRNVPDLKL